MSGTDPARASAAALDPEDVARANLYGLISRLFYGPADSNLLAEICGARTAQSPDTTGELVRAWRSLQETSGSAYPAVVRQEYDTLFVGVGKAQVTPYLSGYSEAAPDLRFARLRERLADWGLARRDGVPEYEDHISGMSDVMRWLIESGRPLGEQQEFFDTFFLRGATEICAAVQKSNSGNFYKHVAAFTAAFLEVERAAFEIGSNS